MYLHVQSLDLKVWEIKARDKKQDGGTFYKNRLNLLFAPIQRYCRRRISQGAAPLARILATKARDEYSTQPPNEQCITRGAGHGHVTTHPGTQKQKTAETFAVLGFERFSVFHEAM
ncbi:hypothetical protein [Vogesella indigofera]|uniref:hypothetical protein n=1 Tax=Vogesella indigofera TaxID=45465 RepID=UPI00234F4394|nr:hypothetical protein [Vogesella indigofera]MDC7706886.1 hypothetical protein [Vogesella indigofera]